MDTIISLLTIVLLLMAITIMAPVLITMAREELIEPIQERRERRASERYNRTHPPTGLEKLLLDQQDKLRGNKGMH